MKLIKTLSAILIVIALISCEKKEDKKDENGKLVLSFTKKSLTVQSSLVNNQAEPAFIAFSIEDQNGNIIFNLEKLKLVKFNNDFISSPLSINIGNYKLTGFLVLDNEGNTIYASPLAGSDKAYLVNRPLPIEFSIGLNEVTKLNPEVLSINNSSAASFGYLTSSFNIVNTLDIYVSVFVYNQELQNFELSNAQLNVNNDLQSYNIPLDAKTNYISLKDGYANYKLSFKKEGYDDIIFDFTYEDLLNFKNEPLKVIFSSNESIVLQPGNELKDAVVSMIVPDANSGNGLFGALYSWTQGGILNTTRTHIEFDLSMFSASQPISSAKLYLYLYETPGYETSGETSFFVRKITSEWNEATITWNTKPSISEDGQLVLASIPENTQILEIDVTNLVKDQIANPLSNHGFCFMLQNESAYRRFVWNSSDNVNSEKRPKLIITKY